MKKIKKKQIRNDTQQIDTEKCLQNAATDSRKNQQTNQHNNTSTQNKQKQERETRKKKKTRKQVKENSKPKMHSNHT